ncbi:MAG TPA: FAD-dependent oxidoreductase [Deltaproteobacteria bacterium]|nr:FAD-dependent oxidoreductase [Deltaproteobacteria bacterium]
MAKTYDIIIVGAGPAGIFCAYELSRKKKARVLIIEKGGDLPERRREELFNGWGGAGAFSDGKLNLSAEVGGFLREYVEESALDELIDYIDGVFVKMGAPSELKGTDREELKHIEEAAARVGLKFIPFRIRHIGTDRCMEVLKNLREELGGRVDVAFHREAEEVLSDSEGVRGVRCADGEEFFSRFVVLAPGRSGAQWLEGVAKRLGLSTAVNPVDVGVRVEVPAPVLSHITDVVHEAKFVYTSKLFDDQVRTFCMNPHGVVVREKHRGFYTVNGHSYSHRLTENTNFAILVSTTFTEPFHEPHTYGRYIAGLANLLGGDILVQRVGDLRHGRRSTAERIRRNPLKPTLKDATPGDLSFVLPYRCLTDILEMLEALDRIAPGINATSTLLYGVEVKFYSLRLKLSRALETECPNLFAAGDGAGITRGIVQAAASGVVAARSILERV